MRDEVGGVAGDDQRPDCAAVSGELAELALGTLTGRERVTALAHLEGCARCSAEVDSLSAAADQLLYLAPATEPPVGFEAGVFERLGLQGKPSRRRSQFGQVAVLVRPVSVRPVSVRPVSVRRRSPVRSVSVRAVMVRLVAQAGGVDRASVPWSSPSVSAHSSEM